MRFSSLVFQPRPDKPIFLTIKSDLSLAIGDSPVARDALQSTLDQLSNADRSMRIFLRADKTVPYGDLMDAPECATQRRLSQGRPSRAGVGRGAMIALAANHGIDRAETARWTLCFAVVVGAHVLSALSLLPSLEASEFDPGAPVVLLELPEAPASLATPPSDLMPGPPEAESEPTPPKEEETKPPEQEAEVALPMPEPPKPKPPTEERPPTALPSIAMPSVPAPPTPGAAVASQSAVNRWESALVAHIERFKRYPAESRAHGEQGIAQVAFIIDHDGWVLASRIVHSSGSPALDAETLAMLSRAQPMPRPPGQLSSRELSFVVPVRFNTK